ncbi:glycosyltransferase family 2 protein [Candidatus Woesearchaeota archaeon]|nr:glycosyltransferase family 2 protein [Candidatus Woesearchaeota archaeon]
MWKSKKVSVIFPTYNEKESIYDSINDFFANGYVDEIVVVNNNAAEGTSEEVKKTKAREVFEKKQGYGYAIMRGLKEAKGDLLIISEPDSTFVGDDVIKLLAYSDNFDVVFSTRTTKSLIWDGANMGLFLKWGNWAIAKMIEVLFNTSTLTDVGGSMRLLSRKSLNRIQGNFTIGGSHFGPEVMLLAIIKKMKCIEIPVNYKKRVGKSSVTGSKLKAFILGLQMINLVIYYRLKSWFGLIK